MRFRTAFVKILTFFLLSFSFFVVIGNVNAQRQTHPVTVNGQITADIYSTLNINPVTVEIYQPSTVTVRILSSSGVGIQGRTVVIVSPTLVITQPTLPTDSSGRATGWVYSTNPGTFTVSALDTTLGFNIEIQNSKTLYVVPVPVPVLLPEPYYTKGTVNTVVWSNTGTQYAYYVEVALDPDFSNVVGNSGWIHSTSYEFTNLENEKMYFYRVKARNQWGGESEWSSYVFSVQDALAPEIKTIDIGGVGESNTVDWDTNFTVEMLFSVRDNLQLNNAVFMCLDSRGHTYHCTSDYHMEGDLLIVKVKLGSLERISGVYLRDSYEFCVEADDAAGNIRRVCGIELKIPHEQEEITEPTIIDRVDKVVEDITNNLDETIGQLPSGNLTAITATTSIVTSLIAFLLAFGSLLNLPFAFVQFFVHLLSWLGFRKGAKPLGYVYDSLTKDPIPQAIIRVYSEDGRIVWTDVTDSKGYFSARLSSGRYKIVVTAQGYIFPSSIVFGKDDYPLKDVYHGEYFEVKENEEFNFSIPLDPRDVSKFKAWEEILKGRIRVLLNILNILLFVVGLIFAIYAFSKDPYWLTLLILLLYIPSLILMMRGTFKKRSKYGVVKDTDGNAVSGVVIGLRELEFDRIVLKRVTDNMGRYRMLAESGRYRLEVLDTNYKVVEIEGDSEILVDKDEEWITKNIVVSKIGKV